MIQSNKTKRIEKKIDDRYKIDDPIWNYNYRDH
jgi:hypothetical protein